MTPRKGTGRGTSVGYRRPSGGLPMSPMPDLLRLHADASGDRSAVIVDEAGGGRPAAVTFQQLNKSVNRLAHALRALGMQPGERLVWCGPNSLEVVTTIHAARKAGQIAVPLSYRFNADEMQYVIDNSDATLVVVDAEQAPLGAEVHITTGPLYHSGPLAFAVISHTLGCPIVVLRRFDPVAWLRLVKEHSVTNTFSAPTQLKRLVSLPPGELERADLSSMRCLIANAAPVPYALKQEVIAKLGDGFLYEVYGSTELGIVTVLKPTDQLRKPGSCGKVYGGIEVRLVREDGTDGDVGEPGELFIRTGLAMDGYHRTDEQLAELSDAGWKSVGDVAYRDDEGFLFINDRKKDMIISGGVNIYPAEIEAVMHEHPQVLDVAVFGIPDDEWGESVYAVVQPKAGETIDLPELREFVEQRVAGYKRPRRYELRDELPRTDAGKLLKRVLRDEFWRDRATAV